MVEAADGTRFGLFVWGGNEGGALVGMLSSLERWMPSKTLLPGIPMAGSGPVLAMS